MRNGIFFILGVVAGVAGVLIFRLLRPRFSRKNGELCFRYAAETANKKKAGKK